MVNKAGNLNNTKYDTRYTKYYTNLYHVALKYPKYELSNLKYGELDRVIFAASAKGLGVYDFIPTNPRVVENPPYIGFSLLDDNLAPKIDCFVFDKNGEVENEIFKFNRFTFEWSGSFW